MGECLRAVGRTREAVSHYELALSLRGAYSLLFGLIVDSMC